MTEIGIVGEVSEIELVGEVKKIGLVGGITEIGEVSDMSGKVAVGEVDDGSCSFFLFVFCFGLQIIFIYSSFVR